MLVGFGVVDRRDYLTEEMFKHCKPLFDKEDPEAREVQCANRMAVSSHGGLPSDGR